MALETVFMFPGQGSHYFQMGRALFEQGGVFRASMLRLDGVIRELCGYSVVETVYAEGRSKGEIFDRTLFTHPAIFMVEYSLAQSLTRAGIVPDVTLGASLGSFAAAAVAGLIDSQDALIAVIRQASAIEACCEPGGMIAILADPATYAEDFLASHSELAAINFSSHFVVATREGCFAQIELGLKQRNMICQRLPVSFAFHSQWIDSAEVPFEAFMKDIRIGSGKIPLVCCDQALSLTDLPESYFWNVTRRPIRFREAIAHLEQKGAYRYIDVGPSGTLATFLRYGLPTTSASSVYPILTPYGRDVQNLAALTAVRV